MVGKVVALQRSPIEWESARPAAVIPGLRLAGYRVLARMPGFPPRAQRLVKDLQRLSEAGIRAERPGDKESREEVVTRQLPARRRYAISRVCGREEWEEKCAALQHAYYKTEI